MRKTALQKHRKRKPLLHGKGVSREGPDAFANSPPGFEKSGGLSFRFGFKDTRSVTSYPLPRDWIAATCSEKYIVNQSRNNQMLKSYIALIAWQQDKSVLGHIAARTVLRRLQWLSETKPGHHPEWYVVQMGEVKAGCSHYMFN